MRAAATSIGPSWAGLRHRWLTAVLRNRDLSDKAKTLATALDHDFVDNRTGECVRTWEALADFLGCSDQTVRRAANELVGAGMLEVESRSGRGHRGHVLRLIYAGKPAPATARVVPFPRSETRSDSTGFPTETRSDSTETRSNLTGPPTPPYKDNPPFHPQRAREPEAPPLDADEERKRGAVRCWMDGRNRAGYLAATPERLEAMERSGECTAAEHARVLRDLGMAASKPSASSGSFQEGSVCGEARPGVLPEVEEYNGMKCLRLNKRLKG